jgi:hypothetical protein
MELETVLPDLQASGEGTHSKRACTLRASERYGQYLTQDRHGRLAIDPAKVRQAERRDGKFVVHSNDDTLTPEDLALGYKQLAQVERAWRVLKSGLRIRPIFHWAPHRICAHVSLTMAERVNKNETLIPKGFRVEGEKGLGNEFLEYSDGPEDD